MVFCAPVYTQAKAFTLMESGDYMNLSALELQAIILDSCFDSIRTLPFLFIAYLLIEFFEHRSARGRASYLARLEALGPIGGAALGCIPQCGFSVAAANFYAGGLISRGTLLAIFISTSDEALPIMLSSPNAFINFAKLLCVKLISAIFFGFLADFVCKRYLKPSSEITFRKFNHHCNCDKHGMVRSAISHSLKVFLFLLIVNSVMGICFTSIGQKQISQLLLSDSAFQPFLTAILGFVPNCAASVVITELYLGGSISFGSAISGLCTGAGLGLAALFRVNKSLKDSLALAGTLYTAAVITGTICDLVL